MELVGLTTVRFCVTPVRRAITKKLEMTSVGEAAEKWEPGCTAGGNVKWSSHSGKQCGGFSKIIQSPSTPATALLGQRPTEEEAGAQTDT